MFTNVNKMTDPPKKRRHDQTYNLIKHYSSIALRADLTK